MTQRSPLQWPFGRKRTDVYLRKPGKFTSGTGDDRKNLSMDAAFRRLEYELDRIGGKNPVVSSNLELRIDGRPRSDRSPPADPGAALYFDLDGKSMVLACDRYSSVTQNLGAIAAHLEAVRAIERHGVGSTAEALSAYVALPAPKAWWEILGVMPDATESQVTLAWRLKAEKAHPDRGGSHAAMAELNAARDAAKKELGV